MKASRRRAWLFVAVLTVSFLPATSASGGGATGVSIGGVDISIDYFLALGFSPTADDSRNASNFTTFNETLTRTLSNSDGLASARVNSSAFIDKDVVSNTLRGFSVNANMNGRATKNENEPTVANPFSSFNISFSPATDVQFFTSVSSSASNTDSEDCSSVEVTLTGPVSFYREAHAGGDCGTFAPASGTTSGTLTSGTYSLDVEADVSMAGEDASASGSASYGVSLYILPPCDVTGTPSDDLALNGTASDDVICGFGGNDTINGGGGNDIILGGLGNDNINGGAGLDKLFGDGGADVMRGGPNTDLMYGADGNDRIFGDDGSETSIANPPNAGLFGGPGDDTLNGGRGNDLAFGDAGSDTLLGAAGNDRLNGGLAPDHLFGGADTDKLFGGDAADKLNGEGGSDELFADAGDDRLTGGGGRDNMQGGDGKDVLLAKDGLKDTVAGGPGRDKAKRDRGLDVIRSIEVFI
jgi:Ca2+-binding RTX toxin-like protein